MAGSSNSSASGSNSSAWLHHSERRTSPVPYRVGPLDYEPAVQCLCCGEKAALWISWSDENPGRRYLKCYRARVNGSQWHQWYDPPQTPFLKTLLLDLRNCVWRLKRENAGLHSAIANASLKLEDGKKKVAELERENGSCRMDAATARAEREEMKWKLQCLRQQNRLLWTLIFCVVVAVIYQWTTN